MEMHQMDISLILRCIERDDAEALAEIIQKGTFDVNHPIDVKRKTILHHTVLSDGHNCFDYLLTVPELQLDCQDVDGVTPLIEATLPRNQRHYNRSNNFVRNPYYIERLLQKGADSSLCNSAGDTPLHLTNSMIVCQVLIDYGCDMNAVNDCGMSALHKVIERESYYELCYVLLYHGIDARIVDDFGRTALSLAIRHGINDDLMELLILYTYDHIKEPIPLRFFLGLMTKKELQFVFEQILDSCSTVSYAQDWELKRFGQEFLNFDVNMLIKFVERKPTVLANIFKDCVAHCRYSLTFSEVFISGVWARNLSCLEFLENNSLFEYYEILKQNIYFACYTDNLENLTTLLYIFLSRGFILTSEFVQSLYVTHGDCNLFRELLLFDNNYSFETKLEDLCKCFRFIRPLCLLILQPNLSLSQLSSMFRSFYYVDQLAAVSLFDYFASRALKDYCRQCIKNNERVKARLVQMPTVPKLLEFARDVTRQHIIKTIPCTKASTFYSYIKHLPISNVYKDILTYKTKIYEI